MTTKNRYSGPGSDEWGTPQDLWDALNNQYHFTIDLAASEQNHKCPTYFSKERSFLDWATVNSITEDAVAWVNPPFSLAGKFFERIPAIGCPTVAIYRADNPETKHWKPIWKSANWIYTISSKRVQYVVDGMEPGQVGFASALIGWRCEPPDLNDTFCSNYPGTLVRNWINLS